MEAASEQGGALEPGQGSALSRPGQGSEPGRRQRGSRHRTGLGQYHGGRPQAKIEAKFKDYHRMCYICQSDVTVLRTGTFVATSCGRHMYHALCVAGQPGYGRFTATCSVCQRPDGAFQTTLEYFAR
jgi:hypothetical protein